MSKCKLQTKICNVRIHVTHEYDLCSVRTNVKYKMCNVRTYVIHEYEMCSFRIYVTYENVISLNLYFTWKYDVVCPNLCCIRKCVMSEYILHTNIYEMCSIRTYVIYWNFMSELMLHTKVWYFSPKWCYIRQYYMHKPILHTKIWCLESELTLHTKICNAQTYIIHEYEMYSVKLMLNTEM